MTEPNMQDAAGSGRDLIAGIQADRRGDKATADALLQPADFMLGLACRLLEHVLEDEGYDVDEWLQNRLERMREA